MAKVRKGNIQELGNGWIDPNDTDAANKESSRRFEQQDNGYAYRPLSAHERLSLIRNGNYAANWNEIQVTDAFMPELIRNSSFFGLVRIGRMSASVLEYKDLKLPVGIYNSYIVSCDIGDDVAIHQVNYLAHFILGNEVILFSVNEMLTSPVAKFGNGMLKEGEEESQRIVLELCNENGNRSVIPFEGMQASDAYLWTRYRDDEILQQRFREMTDKRFDKTRGYYSVVGDSTVIKNSKTIKDVHIGSHAYIKGVNKLKNVTVNSSAAGATQIGEGCELVNGIIGFGCRVFYGVKAVRFVLSSFSQLKYGARLINSFLGDNSTISCCEVLNSLIFPAHEQHHNNSFLCAALVKGQSNVAAGATVGSNHNSRSPDGELIAERGFWPGLCVSLKHNSRFASYTLIVKGDFLYELDIRLPFSLVSLDVPKDELIIIPGYWFLYNAYALMRNNGKFAARDKRRLKNQYFEYDVLGPDTVNEMLAGISEMEEAVGKKLANGENLDQHALKQLARAYFSADEPADIGPVYLERVEASKRKVVLAKPHAGYRVYRRMIRYYMGIQVIEFLQDNSLADLQDLMAAAQGCTPELFDNVGGQLIPVQDLEQLLDRVRSGELDSWEQLHRWYHQWSADYPLVKLKHALCSYQLLEGGKLPDGVDALQALVEETRETKQWLSAQIIRSRKKDYDNTFRKMVYRSDAEMDAVVGKLEENAFIRQQEEEMAAMDAKLQVVEQLFALKE